MKHTLILLTILFYMSITHAQDNALNFTDVNDFVTIPHNWDLETSVRTLKMGDKDGIEAAAIIRKIFSCVKIIMVTDYNEEQLKQKAFNAGANDYLLKEDLIKLKDKFHLSSNNF